MALGRRGGRQQELWVATQDIASGPRHVFYDRLNRLLSEAGFDAWIEQRCRAYYARDGRPSIPPGTFFRMLFVGYFESIDSQRGIAWRCGDSLSLKKFLGYASHEETPDHSSLSRIRNRLPREVFDEVFQFVLQIIERHKLLDGKTAGVDSTTLEANAAMKSIVRRDSGEDWEEYLRRLAAEEGVEIQSKSDLIRYDKDRQQQGKKKVSNEEWVSPSDPEARITKMKDGTTHLAYKAEHVVDLKTEVILAAEIYQANQADTATLTDSLASAQTHLDQAEIIRDIEKVAADKGYHKAETLADCEETGRYGIRAYIPEPDSRWERVWTDKPEAQRRAVYNNRKRTGRDYGKRLQRRRSEVVERTFAHTCDTGGARRTWLRGVLDIGKRYLMQAAAHNLGVLLRKLLGAGKPREFWALYGVVFSLCRDLWTHFKTLIAHREQNPTLCINPAPVTVAAKKLVARLARRWRFTTCSTGC
jgi:IS5 family transposase